jgi:diguanylate cyclase (GGDEF)-like protein
MTQQQQQLVERIRACPNLPSLPTIAVQVLDLAARPEVDIAEIARIISKDPALSGKILRTVNSSFYGRSQHVSTISHALVILGLQSVKTLVLGFSLVSNLTKSKSKGFKHLSYWRHSIYSATAARTIATKLGVVQQEEAFLSALLMDIGMLVLDQVVGDAYGDVHGGAKSHADLPAAETAALGMSHAEVGAMLAEQWKLPPVLTMPIKHHHHPELVEDAALRKVVDIVHASSRCADVFADEQAALAIADVRKMLQERHGLAAADADALLDEINRKTKEVASLFEINIGATGDFDVILRKANEALVELTLRTQQQQSTLVEQNQKLQRQATTDALTGLANRARFDQFLAEQFAASRSTGKPLALLMMDVDKFKSINDRFGHPTGDKVLKLLGALLGQAAREQDLAARFGGEELCLVLPATTRAAATQVAETIRRAIAARPINVGTPQPLPVTASVGVAVLEPPASPLREPSHLLKAADLAVYAAKHGGRNCVKVFTMPAKKPAA